jgi:hypothetical protein
MNTSLTSIESALSPSLGVVRKEVPHPKKDVKSKLKRINKRKLLDRIKEPPTDGWRFNDEEFHELNVLYSFTVKDGVTLWV